MAAFSLIAQKLGSFAYNKQNEYLMKHIQVFVPFTFSESLNPRAIKTVGDQIAAEHLFAFHSREDIRTGFGPSISTVEFSHSDKTVKIKPNHVVRDSNGHIVTLEEMCDSVAASFSGTQHAPYRTLFRSVDCTKTEIKVHLAGIPVNLWFLFTLPDFSIFDPKKIPLSNERHFPSTGPYSLLSWEKEKVLLKKNPYFPNNLVANSAEDVSLNTYKFSQANEFAIQASPSTHHLAYFLGSALTSDSVETLKKSGYQVEIFPSEEVLGVGFKRNVPLSDRILIASAIDRIRKEAIKLAPHGQPAFSMPPSDRPFGLTEEEYVVHRPTETSLKISRPLKLGVGKAAYTNPFLKNAADQIIREVHGLQLELLEGSRAANMYSESSGPDAFFFGLGISPGDPLNHLAFLKNALAIFSDFMSDEQLSNLATITDSHKFIEAVKTVEKRILRERLLVPLAHFPGIVAESPRFKRNHDLAWAWGIQAWTYSIE